MRKIKFRAWDRKQNKMSSSIVCETDGPECTDLNENIQDSLGRYDLMQFTGLHDRNGVEIYEGDICRNGDWETDAHAYNYRIEDVHYIDSEGAFSGWNHNVDGMTCEVIGNIYDNPELLDGK